MEITQADLRIGDYASVIIGSNCGNDENAEQESTLILSNPIERLESAELQCQKSNFPADGPNLDPRSSAERETIAPIEKSADTPNSDLLRNEAETNIWEKEEQDPRSTTRDIYAVVISNEILEELCPDSETKNTESSPRRDFFGRSSERRSAPRRSSARRSTSRRLRHPRLRRKIGRMRERRKKSYESEGRKERSSRLASEASKRREMRMHYETEEQRRKRLDAEAARKREYRMYNETPDERRKRLDREAERRRVKRLTMYASETPEQRRERLNRESAKRREARSNQYAKESVNEKQERLRRDALRAREMRFTRSAIETEEERRQRLVKDALRKRQLRMDGEKSLSNLTELRTVRNFEELNNAQMKDDDQSGGHYLGNWMMWFQNTLAQSSSSEDQPSDEALRPTDLR